jgi:hypothetical protein
MDPVSTSSEKGNIEDRAMMTVQLPVESADVIIPIEVEDANEVLEALVDIFTKVENFPIQTFLKNHGVASVSEICADVSNMRSFVVEYFCACRTAFVRALAGENTSTWNRLFKHEMGTIEEWRANWVGISADLLDFQYFLNFPDVYNNKQLTTVEVCDPVPHAEELLLRKMVEDRFVLGATEFRSRYSGSVWKLPDSDGNMHHCRIDVSNIQRLSQRVNVQELASLQQLPIPFSHINVELVKIILKKFFMPRGLAVFLQPNGSLKLRLNVTPNASQDDVYKSILLTSYTQNGKTHQMIALTWILFFCHGYGTYILCRSDAQEYHVLSSAFRQFNHDLRQWAKGQPEFKGNDLIERFIIHPKPLPEVSMNQLMTQTLFDAHNRVQCICRIRLLQANNARKAHQEIDFLKAVQGHGPKFAVIIDEAQNCHHTLQIQQSLDRAVSDLLATVAIGIEVSATQEPSLIIQNDDKVEMLFIPAKDNYYGYAPSVSYRLMVFEQGCWSYYLFSSCRYMKAGKYLSTLWKICLSANSPTTFVA